MWCKGRAQARPNELGQTSTVIFQPLAPLGPAAVLHEFEGAGLDVHTGDGWVLAQWAVAQAVQLRITEVSFAGRAWRAARSADGWVPDRSTPVRPNGDVRITVAR